MKLSLAAAALLAVALPSLAHAQVAAGTVPNTFDRPAQGAPAQAAPAPAPAAPAAPANANSEDALRAFIAGVQAGRIEYAPMSDDLAAKVREQEPGLIEMIKGFGAVQAVDFMAQHDGADVYAVTFAEAATQWLIAFNDQGKIAALLFRPIE